MKLKAGPCEIAVNVPSMAALLGRVRDRFETGEGFALATINLDHLVKLRGSDGFRADYAAQDFVVADGNPIVWLSRLAGDPVELVPGSDAVLPLARLAAECGVSVALIGSTEQSLAAAADALRARVPGLEIALCVAPPMGFDAASDAAAKLLRDVEVSGARLAFVALGAPKQEALAARGRALAPSVGFASIGAGLDFLAGTQTRAPKWVQAIAMEWLWRALSSPARLGPRYLKCLAILPGHGLRALRARLQKG